MAHVTDLGFHQEDLMWAVNNGDVRVQFHPEFPNLAIFNYTEEAQYKNRWNKITLACRGLILDLETGAIVARPWEKFFNLGQMDNRIESYAPVEVTDKIDGSLGILYRRPDGQFAIATRGSFASDQALHATELLNTKYGDYSVDFLGGWWMQNNTYLFEIVYPENRIVVNYDGLDDLVLLGAVDKARGFYYGPTAAGAQIAWPGPYTDVWNFNSFVDAISFPDRKGKEGIVIRSGDKMVKLKQADYVELHRIVTNLNPRSIWEMLGNGSTVAGICAEIPDEFHKYVEDIGNDLLRQATDLKYAAKSEYLNIISEWGLPPTRKQFAAKATKSTYKIYLFLLLDGKPIDEVVWQAIKPRGDAKAMVEEV